MGLSMMFYYRRNLNGVPMSIQRAMHKQAMRDAYPHVFSDEDLNEIVDKKIQNGEPYEEELLYLRNAHAIHEYLVKHLAGGVDNADFGPYEISIDLIKRLVIGAGTSASTASPLLTTRTRSCSSSSGRRSSRSSVLLLRTRISTRIRSSTKAHGDNHTSPSSV